MCSIRYQRLMEAYNKHFKSWVSFRDYICLALHKLVKYEAMFSLFLSINNDCFLDSIILHVMITQKCFLFFNESI